MESRRMESAYNHLWVLPLEVLLNQSEDKATYWEHFSRIGVLMDFRIIIYN